MNEHGVNSPALAVKFEGYDLPAFLTCDDIVVLVGSIVTRDTVLRWFRTGKLRGVKLGRNWMVRGSQFVEDWAALEHGMPALAESMAIKTVARVAA